MGEGRLSASKDSSSLETEHGCHRAGGYGGSEYGSVRRWAVILSDSGRGSGWLGTTCGSESGSGSVNAGASASASAHGHDGGQAPKPATHKTSLYRAGKMVRKCGLVSVGRATGAGPRVCDYRSADAPRVIGR